MTTEPIELPSFSNLSPNKFLVVIDSFQSIELRAQSVILPTITLGTNRMPTNKSHTWSTPGDTIEYDDLVVSFIVDEDLTGYRMLKKWQEAIAATETPQDRFSDIKVLLLTNNSTKNFTFSFKDTFPYMVGTIPMDTTQTEDQTLTVDVTFKFSTFTIENT